MDVAETLAECRRMRDALEGRVAFVPTMGALHDGHLSLMREAHARADHLIVSIYVNPTQFGPNEDLDTYPRQNESDLAKCEAEGASFVFLPSDAAMYPAGNRDQATTVTVGGLTDGLCGASRPGHFDGVTTIVSKLFNVVQPDVAVFGQKDYQQLAVIRRMVSDLNFPVEIVGAPTRRESDGLAMSSRNLRLSADERTTGLGLSRGLAAAWSAHHMDGQNDAAALTGIVSRAVSDAGGKLDYVECVHPDSLKPLGTVGPDGAVIAVAVFVGPVRLIDNVSLHLDLPSELARVEA